MIVVPVLIMSCQVSLKPKIGPEIAHSIMMANAVPNAAGCPIACAVSLASRPKRDVVRIGIVFLGASANQEEQHQYGHWHTDRPEKYPPYLAIFIF